ncbi:MAG: hypothetical protein GTO18_09870 [Anaerolineales bacterium]|nr:hypothetical protein [Anaerolineales bacterium]
MSNEILDRLTANPSGVALCWLGNLSWLIHCDDMLVGIDLDLDLELRIDPSPIPADIIAPILKIHLITHGHGDHFNDVTSQTLTQNGECLFVLPANCMQKAKEIGIPAQRIHIARPGDLFHLLGVQIEPLHAIHGHKDFSIFKGANFDDCGYVLTIGGLRILQPGDSVLLEEHLELQRVDILFISPTIHNMFTDRSAILINTLQPNYIFPQHYGTYLKNDENAFWTVGFPDELYADLPKTMQNRFHKLKQGEFFHIE